MNDQNNHHVLKIIVDWVAALLGIATFAGFVHLAVGILSAMWLSYQLYVAIKYELPIKQAKLEAALEGRLEETKPGQLK